MLTKDQAINANEFHWGECAILVGPKGGEKLVTLGRNGQQYSHQRVRRNGKTQTWETRPDEWRIPCKFGLYGYVQIWHQEAVDWHTAEGCEPRTMKVRRVT